MDEISCEEAAIPLQEVNVQAIRPRHELSTANRRANGRPVMDADTEERLRKSLTFDKEAWQRCRQGLSPDSSPKWDVVKWLRDYIPSVPLNHPLSAAYSDTWKALCARKSPPIEPQYHSDGLSVDLRRDLGHRFGPDLSDTTNSLISNREARLLLQKHLYCELQPRHARFRFKFGNWGTSEDAGLNVGPWISNMALRMLEYPFREMPYPYFEVLLEVLHSLDPSSRAFPLKEESLTLRELMKARKHDPYWTEFNSGETAPVKSIRRKLQAVIEATKLMDIWAQRDPDWIRQYLSTFQSRNGILDKPFLCMMKEINSYPRRTLPRLPETDKATFHRKDMSLGYLRTHGKLEIEWTEYLAEHLELDVETRTLYVYWFGHTSSSSTISRMLTDLMTEDESDPYWVTNRTNGKNEELPITYALLFSDGSGNPNLKEYGQLPIPPWLRVFYGDESGLLPSDRAKDMSYILDSNLPLCKDVEFHLKPDLDQPQIADIQVIEKYAMFGHRLRVLKAFLDSQKPRGLVGMWKDRRDSEKWHTFWAVLVIGGVSLILGFFTLIVSIAQTIASFKALNPQS